MPPTGVTTYAPSSTSSQRTHVRALASLGEIGCANRARTSGGTDGSTPSIRRSAGRTKTSNDTYALTGLPGSVKIGVASGPTVPKPCGMPGCIATLSNSTVPSRDSTSLTTS